MSNNMEGMKNSKRGHSGFVSLFVEIAVICILLGAISFITSSSKGAAPAASSGTSAAPAASSGTSAARAAPEKSDPIPPEEFFFPDEPLPTPGVQLSRETKPSWSEEEAKRWFVSPTKKDLDELRRLGEESVNRLLEAVP